MGNSDSQGSKSTPSQKNESCKTQLNPETEEATQAVKEFEHKLREIELSLQRDNSMANLIDQMGNVIEMEGLDKMACVERIVQSMGSEWQSLMSFESQITEAVGTKEMSNLKSLRCEYLKLLLKTKTVIVGLLEDSQMQHENVQDALEVVRAAQNNGEAKLGEEERLVFDESIVALSRWIDQSELVKITEEWNKLCCALERQKTRFQRSFEKYKRKSLCTKVVLGVGAVIALAGVIGLVIATAGAAAPAAAAVAAAAGTKVTVFTTLGVSAAIGVGCGALIVGGAVAYGYCVKPSEMAQRIQKISDMLREYIITAQKMQIGINDMDGKRKQMKGVLKFDYQACLKLRRSLGKIQRYLNEYIDHGKAVTVEIEKACQEFIK